MSVEEKFKTKEPERWGCHRITLSYDDDKTIGEMIGRSLRRRHRIQEEQTEENDN
jgi:hypothetical protein